MEFLEFLNLDNTTNKKCSKVRSWYLYEQFKSLEKNQLDAAKRLKERSLQEKILLQELNERRERRRFCEQGGGECNVRSDLPSKDPMDLEITDSKDCLFSDGSASLLSVKCESADSAHYVVQDASGCLQEDTSNLENTEKECVENSCDEYCAKVENIFTPKEEESNSETGIKDLDGTVQDKLPCQLETVQEEIERIQNYTTLCEDAKSLYVSSSDEFCCSNKKQTCRSPVRGSCAAVSIWTKLVSFAYQIMQVTHGNCYYDYSTQILTAILACDIIRRGLCKMSDFLQPYTCPVRLPDGPCYLVELKTKSKKKLTKKERKQIESKKYSTREDPKPCAKRCSKRKACSEYRYQDLTSDNWTDDTKVRRHSEPWHRGSRATNAYWRKEFNPYRAHYSNLCRCCKHTSNPMMRLSYFIDKVVSEILSSSSREKL